MDTYVGNVYISDMDTYELLYLNQHSCDTLGYPLASLIGKSVMRQSREGRVPAPSAPMTVCGKMNFMSGSFIIRLWNGLS